MSSAFYTNAYAMHLGEVRVQITFASKTASACEDLSHATKFLFLVPFSDDAMSSRDATSPKILSALYGYDGCIGGVNSFSTEEQYLQELKRFVSSISAMMKI